MRASLFVALVPMVALADPRTLDGFRCPDTGRIINLGATRYEVESLCRAPDDVVVSTEERLVQRRARVSDFVRQNGSTTTTTTTRTPPQAAPPTQTQTNGDGTGIIIAMMQAPAANDRTTTTTTTTTTNSGSRVRSATNETLVAELQEVLVEEWVYDFGRNRFLRFLRFENGRLVAVLDGRKGAKPAEH